MADYPVLDGAGNTIISAANSGASKNPVVAALAGDLSVVPRLNTGGELSLQSNASGATFNAFGSQACKQLTINNDTGTKIEVRTGAETVYQPILDGMSYTFYGITNANQLAYRRADLSNTQVTLKARWEA